MAASIASAALALFGILPKLLAFPFRRATTRLYARLEQIEKALGQSTDRAALLGELDDIEKISAALRVPKALRADYLQLRQNVHDVRDRAKSV